MFQKIAKIITSIFAWLIIIAGLGGIIYFAWIIIPWLSFEVIGLYSKAETEFKLGLITAILSTAGIIWSVIYQRKKELETLRFERKREAYNAFFDLLFDFMAATDAAGVVADSPETRAKFRELTKKMMIWGSAKTINSFNKFQEDSSRSNEDAIETLRRVENILRQFRADLGHNDRSLKNLALTKLVIRGDEHHKLDG